MRTAKISICFLCRRFL